MVCVLEEPDPVPGPGEIVIETAISALCGRELKTYCGNGRAQGNSGHEAVGTIVSIGEGVADLQVDQRVGASSICGGGECV